MNDNGPKSYTPHFALIVESFERVFFLDPVSFLSAGVQPGLRELSPSDGPDAISRNPFYYQMVSHPVTFDESGKAPDPVFVDDRRPFLSVSEL